MRASFGIVLLLSVPAGAQTPADAAPRVGLASVVERRAEARRDDTVRTLVLRDALFRNERLSTGPEPGTKLHVRMLDQTVLTLGPNSEVVLDDFAINPEAGTAEVSLKLSRGLLRFVGGKHVDTGTRYQVRTPVATIGVRGTAFDVKVEDDGGTTVQLTEGELSFENEDGLEVILDEPLETSSLDDADDAPSEPEVDEALAEEFDSLDLSDEEAAADSDVAEALEEEELEAIDGEDPDEDAEATEDDAEADEAEDGESAEDTSSDDDDFDDAIDDAVDAVGDVGDVGDADRDDGTDTDSDDETGENSTTEDTAGESATTEDTDDEAAENSTTEDAGSDDDEADENDDFDDE